jgi:hypothetical protein
MPYMSTLVHAEHIITGPVRPRTTRDRAYLAAMLRRRRATREVLRTGAERVR